MAEKRSKSWRGHPPARWLLEGLLITGAVAAALFVFSQKRYSNEDLLRHFDVIAFNSEFAGPSPYVMRWEGPVRIHLKGVALDRFRPRLAAFITGELIPLTGLDFSFVEAESQANMLVFHYPRDELAGPMHPYWHEGTSLEALLQRSQCFVRLHSNQRRQIVAALVAIPVYAADERVTACIVEEMTQAMGLLNDADEVRPSVFNDLSLYQELTTHDRLLLRTLYDPRLSAGMPRRQVLPLAAQILAELRPE